MGSDGTIVSHEGCEQRTSLITQRQWLASQQACKKTGRDRKPSRGLAEMECFDIRGEEDLELAKACQVVFSLYGPRRRLYKLAIQADPVGELNLEKFVAAQKAR
jgi:hypothetical protein